MRVLIWEKVRKEIDRNAAFNMALLKAIDPRIITHRPRDPEKASLMKELGMDTRQETIASTAQKTSGKKSSRKCLVPVSPDQNSI